MTAGPSLAGKRVVNTRAIHQAGELDRLLEAHGAIPLSFPCIAIRPPDDLAPLEAALRELAAGRFDWVVFTSVNTVEAVAGRLSVSAAFEPSRQAAREPVKGSPTGAASVKVAAVGPVTGEAVGRLLGREVDFQPTIETAAALGEEMPVGAGDGVLLPQSAIGGLALAAILNGRGARVTEVVAYATGVGSGGIDLASSLAAGAVDAICLTSPSTVRGLCARLGRPADLTGVRIACIGPETAAAARDLGLRVDVVPAAHTTPSLVEALAASFAIDSMS